MDVSMNGLRWSLLDNFNILTKKLNRSINDGTITLSPSEIQKQMDNIRESLVILSFMYKEGS